MVTVRTYLESKPKDLEPDLYWFGPPERPRTFSEGWFRWFYLAELPKGPKGVGSCRLVIGPFLTKVAAQGAWELVVARHQLKELGRFTNYFRWGIPGEYQSEKDRREEEKHFAEDVFEDRGGPKEIGGGDDSLSIDA
jgi:hypothetical protein